MAEPGARALDRLAYWLAVGFGSGLLPRAPGTWGSLAALAIGIFVLETGDGRILNALIGLTLLAGFWAAGRHAKLTGKPDAGEVVIDEFVGQWIALVPLAHAQPFGEPAIGYALAFAAFRLFDIWKPWPVRWLERNIHGGPGVMLDDVAAGLLAGILLVLIGMLP